MNKLTKMKIPFLRTRTEHVWDLSIKGGLKAIYVENSGNELYSLSIYDKWDDRMAKALVHKTTPEIVEVQEGQSYLAEHLTRLTDLAESTQFEGLSKIIAHIKEEEVRRRPAPTIGQSCDLVLEKLLRSTSG